ncbi:MAG: potassium channel protein [Bacteroidales bacterium]|nr:potassium channel protein [Bacteroidales bacterium]
MTKIDLKPAYFSLVLLFIIVITGVFGYIIIEKFNFLDAFFMTIITIATVGFQEVHPLSPLGRIFTAFLIIFSFGIFAYTITTLTRYVVDGVFRNYFKYSKVKKQIGKLANHVIVVGYGRNGSQAVEELHDHGIKCVIIENRPEKVIELQQRPDLLYIAGDPSHDEILKEAGVDKARALITVYPTDEENLFVVVTAREMNPEITIISRAIDFTTIKKLYAAGASNVIMPDKIGGQRMAKMVAQPNVVEFLESIMLQKHEDVSLEEISCDGLAECFSDHTIGELNIRNLTGANIIGLKSKDGYIFNPSSSTKLSSDDLIFALGAPQELTNLKEILKGRHIKI